MTRSGLAIAANSTSPLKRREFRLYFTGNLVSNCGTWLQNAALSVYLYNLTESSFWVGVASAAYFLPVMLLALPAGALADRSDRLRLMKQSQLAAGALALVLASAVGMEVGGRYLIIGLVAAMGVFGAVAIPAMQSMVPSLVPRHDIGLAIGLNSLTFNIARVIGPTLAAGALSMGAVWAFGLNAVSYFVLAGALALVGRLPFPRERGEPGTIAQGVRYAWENRRMRGLLLSIMAVSAALDPITTLAPALVNSFGEASNKAPLIFSSWGAGAVLGVTAGSRILKGLSARNLGWVGLPVLALGLLCLAASPSLPLALGAGLITGWGYIVATITLTTAIQTEVPEALRGRISALWTIAFLGPRIVSGLVDGMLADRLGPHLATALFSLPALAGIRAARRALNMGVARA
ncbi:MAG: MFS transporter [Actinomycetota bacterium]